MPSSFFGLTVAYSGLNASQASINTTANNISNVQTKGYSKQTVNLTAASAASMLSEIWQCRNGCYDGFCYTTS